VYPALELRRTVRWYQERAVGEDVLARLAQAVTLAPSAHHSTPWHLTVICGAPALRRLAVAMAAAWDRDMAASGVPAELRRRRTERSVRRLGSAPAGILTSLDTRRLAGDAREETMMVQSVAAATYAILLAAAYEGLGAAWNCPPLFCPAEVRSALGLPEYLRPQALVTLGYPREAPGPRPVRSLEGALTWIRAAP
jgi:coenzyme F420-0:L-glutamate ligase/coenzyme F420-1:gamma-L-glutamate ligase